MSQANEGKLLYSVLPRGGYLVETSCGYIQFGSPPETIKDTMGMEKGTPNIFVLPFKFFHLGKGITTAELEFPIYYNFFFRKQKTRIVCTEEQKSQFTIVLRESLFGPEHIDLRSEFIDGEKHDGYPDMNAEVAYFRGGRKFEDHLEFLVFDKDNCVTIDSVKIFRKEDSFTVIDDRQNAQADIPGEVGFNIIYDKGERLIDPYVPPLLAITCLGSSTGFDPEDNTSGFVVWINHQGIVVDPPVNSTEWLRESNVNPRLINSIILTHCHADHDAGTFQKILEEGRVTIYTTETVIHSFVTKYHALTGISRKELFLLFDFVPVIIGRSYYINGAEFRFKYALHSIPSLSFEFFFQDQSFIYSSDHLNDPEQIKIMYDKGVLPETRYKELMNFPYHYSTIYHEAGPPPLHTRIEYLNTLPEEIQKKIYVYHIPRKNMPQKTSLHLCKFGMENTVNLNVTPPRLEAASRLLDVLNNVDIFRDFPITKAREFLDIAEEKTFKRGEVIIHQGTPGDYFYIIVSGNVKLEGTHIDEETGETVDGRASFSKRSGSYEYFGEMSILLNQLRMANVIAETDVDAVAIEKNRFLNFIKDSDLIKRFERLNEIRKTGTWDILSNSRFFKGTTTAQKTNLELIMEPLTVKKGKRFIGKGTILDSLYIIRSGNVEVKKENQLIEKLKEGDICGEVYKLQKETIGELDFIATTNCELYRIQREKIMIYISDYPSIYMKLNYIYGN